MGLKRINKLVPVDIGVANAIGAIPGNARADHVHNHPAGLGFDLHHDHFARMLWDILSGADILRSVARGATARILFIPIDIPFTVTIDSIGYIVGATAAGNARVAIYEDGGAGDTPASADMIVESASVAQPGVNQKHELPVADTELTPGLYWLAIQLDDATGTWRRPDDFGRIGGTLNGWAQNQVYGAFPDPAGVAPYVHNVGPTQFVMVASVP